MERVEVKMAPPWHMKCVFDPRRACGSHARSASAYRRAELLRVAELCGVRDAASYSVDQLCALLRGIYFDHKRVRAFLGAMRLGVDARDADSFLAVPRAFGGSLAVGQARALLGDAGLLRAVRAELEAHRTRFSDVRKLYVFETIFFGAPKHGADALSAADHAALDAFVAATK